LPNYRLQGRNEAGIMSHICDLTKSEADYLVGQKKAVKMSRDLYRLIPESKDSLSQPLSGMLTARDIEAFAGLHGKPNQIMRERFEGWGLVRAA